MKKLLLTLALLLAPAVAHSEDSQKEFNFYRHQVSQNWRVYGDNTEGQWRCTAHTDFTDGSQFQFTKHLGTGELYAFAKNIDWAMSPADDYETNPQIVRSGIQLNTYDGTGRLIRGGSLNVYVAGKNELKIPKLSPETVMAILSSKVKRIHIIPASNAPNFKMTFPNENLGAVAKSLADCIKASEGPMAGKIKKGSSI
jgi:hypothetical protein